MEALLSGLSPTDIGLGLVAGVIVIILRPKGLPITFRKPEVEALVASLATVVLSAILVTVLYAFRGQSSMAEDVPHIYGLRDVVNQIMLYAMIGWPILVSLVIRRQGPSTLGFRRENLGKSFVVGTVPGLAILALLPVKPILNPSAVCAFLSFVVIGFGEEISFRGYLQTRLVSALGPWVGLTIASLWMALLHFPGLAWSQGLGVMDAIFNCLGMTILSLLVGCVMLRCQNLVAPIILHIFVLWLDFLY